MSMKPLSVPTKVLAASINAAASSFRLNNIEGWDGTNLTSADFGTQHFVVFRNAARTQIELMEIDPTTIASASITILRRGLDFTGDLTTEISANKLSWVKGDTLVDLGTDTPQFWQFLKEYIDGVAIAGSPDASTSTKGISKMSTAPASATNPIAVGDNDPRVPTQAENDAMAGTPGTPSSTNKFVTQAISVTAGETINGTTLPVPVYQDKTDNEFYACDGNDLTKLKFSGFAISNGTNGNTMLLQTEGIVSGFTGLDEGQKYYLSDTAGTISNTPGTYEILVGIGISTTQLLIVRGKRRASGSQTLSASGSTTITTGFRPSVVRVYAVAAQTGTADVAQVSSNGVWTIFGGNDCVNFRQGSSDEVIGEVQTVAWYLNIAGNIHSGVIDNITDTSFDLNNTKSGSIVNALLVWEAEGEL